MGHREGSPEREVHTSTGLNFFKNRKLSNKQPNATSTRTRGTTTKKVQSKYKEGNDQVQRQLNDIEPMNPGAGSLKR